MVGGARKRLFWPLDKPKTEKTSACSGPRRFLAFGDDGGGAKSSDFYPGWLPVWPVWSVRPAKPATPAKLWDSARFLNEADHIAKPDSRRAKKRAWERAAFDDEVADWTSRTLAVIPGLTRSAVMSKAKEADLFD
jgi:hypothetical protein